MSRSGLAANSGSVKTVMSNVTLSSCPVLAAACLNAFVDRAGVELSDVTTTRSTSLKVS